jgi:hypothetical protein
MPALLVHILNTGASYVQSMSAGRASIPSLTLRLLTREGDHTPHRVRHFEGENVGDDRRADDDVPSHVAALVYCPRSCLISY